MLEADSPTIREFLDAWHENGRRSFEKEYTSLNYDSPSYAKHARQRRKYIALDEGTGGVFLVDRETQEVYTIKAYGVPKLRCGSVSYVAARFRTETERQRAYYENPPTATRNPIPAGR